jgi:hypothetical protein
MSRTRKSCLRIVLAAATIPLCIPLACKSAGKVGTGQGLLLSATLPVRVYMMDSVHASGSKEREFRFPSLQIYNSSGYLIYSGTDPFRNVRVLRSLPSEIQNLAPIQRRSSLSRLVEAIPEFRAREKDILRTHRPVVVSADLEGCDGCSVQAEALNGMTAELRRQPVDVLLIRVQQP